MRDHDEKRTVNMYTRREELFRGSLGNTPEQKHTTTSLLPYVPYFRSRMALVCSTRCRYSFVIRRTSSRIQLRVPKGYSRIQRIFSRMCRSFLVCVGLLAKEIQKMRFPGGSSRRWCTRGVTTYPTYVWVLAAE